MSQLYRVTEAENADKGHRRQVALPRGAYVVDATENTGLASPGDLVANLPPHLAKRLLDAGLAKKSTVKHEVDEDKAEPKLPKLDDLAEFISDQPKRMVENMRARDRRARPGSRGDKIYRARLKELVDE